MATFHKIASVEIGSGGASTIDFNSIPGTYKDLYIVSSCRSNSGTTANDGRLSFNGNTSSYSSVLLYSLGTGTPASASNSGSYLYWVNSVTANGLTSNAFSNTLVYIPGYASSNPKTVYSDTTIDNNSSFGANLLTVGLWNSANPITSMSFTMDYTGFSQYSTMTLYGV